MKRVRDIKRVRTEIKKIESQIEILLLMPKKNLNEISSLKKSLLKLKSIIKSFKKHVSLEVSEHAIVRYFERVLGVDIDEVKGQILNEQILRSVQILGGSGKFRTNDFEVRMQNYTVVSVI